MMVPVFSTYPADVLKSYQLFTIGIWRGIRWCVISTVRLTRLGKQSEPPLVVGGLYPIRQLPNLAIYQRFDDQLWIKFGRKQRCRKGNGQELADACSIDQGEWVVLYSLPDANWRIKGG